MEDCIFCNIIAGKIPSYKLYEDEYILSFLDISQTTKGHALVIPKKHFKDIFELDEEYSCKLLSVVRIISTLLKDTLNCSGVNIVSNNGVVSGQTVNHFHIHVIPRYNDSDFNIDFTINEFNNDALEKTLATIKKNY